MDKRTRVWAAGLVLLPAAAWADEPPFAAATQEITVTATRIATPAVQVPAGVTVIDAKQIAERGYVTLVDALTAVPGLAVVQAGGAGTQASVFVRGTNSEDVLVLLDGVPVNDPSDANGAFNFGTVTLSDVARIEVIRGPMSGLYGSNAIGGVINIVTLRGSGQPAVTASAAGGWPAQGQGSLQVSGARGAFDYAATGALDEEAGFDQAARRLSVYGGVRDPFRSKLGSLELGYSPVDGTRVSLVLRAQTEDAAFPDLGYPIYDDPDEFDHNTAYFGRLGVSSVLFDGALTTDLFVARLLNTLRYQNLLDAADPNQVQADDVYHGDRTDVQWNNTVHLPDAGVAALSSVMFGVEYADDSSNETVNEVDFGSPFTETVHASQHTIAGHAGAQTVLAERLTLTAALRDDSVSSFGNALTGRIGGVVAVPEADLRLKASYGTGFLAPSLFELYGVDNFGYVGNPKLRPEYSSGFEVGPELTVPALRRDDFADLSVTYFSSAIRDLITSTPNFESEENIGRADIEGVESELALDVADFAQADFSYSYTKSVDAQTNAPLLRRPQNAGAIVLTLGPVAGVTVTPQLQFVGRFADYLYDNNGYPLGDGYARPGTIFNLNARYVVTDQIALFADGKNLFRSRFEPVNGLQVPGASLLLGVQGKLQ